MELDTVGTNTVVPLRPLRPYGLSAEERRNTSAMVDIRIINFSDSQSAPELYRYPPVT